MLLVMLCAVGSHAERVTIQTCDGLSETRVNMTDISVENVYLGEHMIIHFTLSTNRALPNIVLGFNLNTAGFTLPCNRKTEFGSCDYSMCGRKTFRIEESLCAAWNCKCPIQSGSYVTRSGIKFQMPNFNGIIGTVITRSPTVVTIRLKEEGKAVFCGRFPVKIKSRNTQKLFGIFGRLSCAANHVEPETDESIVSYAYLDDLII